MFSPWRGRWGEPPTASTTSPAMWAYLLGSGSSCLAKTVVQREADPSKPHPDYRPLITTNGHLQSHHVWGGLLVSRR